MQKSLTAISIGLGFILLVGLGEFAINQLPSLGGEQSAALFRSRKSTSSLGFGNLCSSRSNCFVFCKNNVGRCQNYCKKNPAHNFCTLLPAAKPQPWKSNSITQPLPEGASKVRLALPAPLDAISLSGIGAFGVHPGGHGEGLDHEWILVNKDIPIRSWADGEVVWARRAPGDAGYEKGTRTVVIYYGDGLWGEHMHVREPLVKEGQKVKAGDPVAYGEIPSHDPDLQSAEFNVADQRRRDGVGYWYKFVTGATLVSPFDYLEDTVKRQLEEKWQKEIIEPYLAGGVEVDDLHFVPTPWEPYLTNPLLFHRDYPGTLEGEWFLRSRAWANDGVPDILIFFAPHSAYYQKKRLVGVEDRGQQEIFQGDWSVDYTNKRIILDLKSGTVYGIFEIDESKPQATLKLEYQKGEYPKHFSSRALLYTERDLISKGEELYYWRNPQDDPRRW